MIINRPPQAKAITPQRAALMSTFCVLVAVPLYFFNVAAVDLFLKAPRGEADHYLRGELKDETSLPGDLMAYDSQLMAASGQHLLLDMVGGNFKQLNDEKGLRDATLRIIEDTKMTLLGIQSYKLQPQGVSVVATLAESHLSIHTWPEHGTALIDLFTCGPGVNLQEHLAFVVSQYGGNVTASTYSLVPRGEAASRVGAQGKGEDQFQPAEIMPIHKYKHLVYEVQSPYQHIAIWDHHDTQDDDFGNETTRSLFLDGVIQSNVYDEENYHECLVHPAFIGSAKDPKRVLIVGGGEGGTLREVLKWESVEKVVMVELDAEVIKASRAYLPSYSNCLPYGPKSCFDDERVELYTEDFVEWFDDHLGDDICETAKEKQDLLFDVIILDLLDTEALPEDEDWAEHLYSDEFFESIACATSRWGVVVTNMGEAPEGPFDSGPPGPLGPLEQERLDMFTRKLKTIQTMSRYFIHNRVYDTAVPSYRANWAFAIGMAPRPNNDPDEFDSAEEEVFDIGNEGINDFDGIPARVNLKMHRGFKPGANCTYYDGAVQHGFQYPTGDWVGVYCLHPDNKPLCQLMNTLLNNTDYEEELFELHLDPSGDQRSGIVAKKDIPKGTVTGLWDAATSLEYPATDFYEIREMAKDWGSSSFRDFGDWVYRYGFDGGMGGTGEVTYTSTLSKMGFMNHACDGNPAFNGLAKTYPWAAKLLWGEWNPLADTYRTEINHITIAQRDIKKGEMITDDYSRWDGYMHNLDEEWGHPGVREWCGDDNPGVAPQPQV